MIKVIDAGRAETFARATYDVNDLHNDESMWEKHGLPAIVPGFQLFLTAMSTIKKDDLMAMNHGRAYFNRAMVPVGSEVDFSSKKTGMMRTNVESQRLIALANGLDVLDSGDNQAKAEKLETKNGLTFYEGNIPLTIRVNDSDLASFQEVTELPSEAVPSLYAVAISTASISERIMHPTTPAWTNLHKGYNNGEGGKRLIPAYDSIQFYLPGGMRGYQSRSGLIQRSAIQPGHNVYTVDTICHDGDQVLCGVRSVMRVKSERSMTKILGRMLTEIGKSDNPGTLEQTIARMERLNSQTDSGSGEIKI